MEACCDFDAVIDVLSIACIEVGRRAAFSYVRCKIDDDAVVFIHTVESFMDKLRRDDCVMAMQLKEECFVITLVIRQARYNVISGVEIPSDVFVY